MARPVDLSVSALARSSLVVAGVLLLLVGFGNLIVGRSKIAQYQLMVRETPPPPPRDPAQLFPTASEAEERHGIAIAKLGYYQLLFTAGQSLSALGFLLLGLGVLRVRFRTAPVEGGDQLTS